MKKIILGIGIFLVIIIGIIGFFIFGRDEKKEIVSVTPTPMAVLPTVSGNIIVDLIAKPNNQAVALKVKGITSDIESIEYELTYLTGSGLPRGVLGKITLKGGEKEINRDDIVLGTCSSGKCVFDTGVTSIDLSLKFNTTDGASVFRKTYPL